MRRIQRRLVCFYRLFRCPAGSGRPRSARLATRLIAAEIFFRAACSSSGPFPCARGGVGPHVNEPLAWLFLHVIIVLQSPVYQFYCVAYQRDVHFKPPPRVSTTLLQPHCIKTRSSGQIKAEPNRK